MSVIKFPYGKEMLSLDIPDEKLNGILVSKLHDYHTEKTQEELVLEAMANPVGSDKLCDMAVGKNKVVIIGSDHTRPVPSKAIMPAMLAEIRKGNPDADITILIATGCHRGTTKDELIAKFGEEIVANEKIYIHDCDETDMLVKIGTLPSGGELIINKLAVEADLLVAEGFIEPHFFAGFSGARKSVLPGIASRTTVLANHCSEFIASPYARTGILENNPIHEDMVYAGKTAKLAYIVNVVINEKKEAIYAVAGDMEKAHQKGCEFLSDLCKAQAVPSDIVISTNGGYPLDQNIYQSVKGMTAAEATVKKDGVIIMLSKCNDGTGGDHFYHQMAEFEDINKIEEKLMARGRNETLTDQWMTQILVRILKNSSVVYVSDAPDDMIKSYHMIPAHSLDEAMEKAYEILGNKDAKVMAIPDGVSVMVVK